MQSEPAVPQHDSTAAKLERQIARATDALMQAAQTPADPGQWARFNRGEVAEVLRRHFEPFAAKVEELQQQLADVDYRRMEADAESHELAVKLVTADAENAALRAKLDAAEGREKAKMDGAAIDCAIARDDRRAVQNDQS